MIDAHSFDDYRPYPDDDENTPSPIDKSFDTTDIQGSWISNRYKNDETKEYEKDHSSSWRHTIASIKLKLSGL